MRLLIVLFIAYSSSVWAKTPDLSKSYSFFNFTKENGLPSNSVKAIVQGPHGYLWVGTEKGLVRYDGSTFDPIIDFKSAVISHGVNTLLADSAGIWAGTETGLMYISSITGSIVNYFKDSTKLSLTDNFIKTLAPGPNGSLWAGSYSGLTRIGKTKSSKYLTTGNGLNKIIIGISKVSKDNYLVTSKKDLFIINTSTDSISKIELSGAKIGEITASVRETDSTWLIAGTNLCRIEVKNGVWHSSIAYQNTGMYSFRSLVVTEDGLWTGTRGYGLLLLQRQGDLYVEVSKGLKDQTVEAIYQDKDGVVWVGTWQGLYQLNRLAGSTDLVNIHDFDHLDTHNNGMVSDIYPISDTGIFVKMEKGVFYFYKKNKQWQGLKPEINIVKNDFFYPVSPSLVWYRDNKVLSYAKITGEKVRVLKKFENVSFIQKNEHDGDLYIIQNSQPVIIKEDTVQQIPGAEKMKSDVFVPLAGKNEYIYSGKNFIVVNIGGKSVIINVPWGYGTSNRPMIIKNYAVFKSSNKYLSLHLPTCKTDTFTAGNPWGGAGDFYFIDWKDNIIISQNQKYYQLLDIKAKKVLTTKIPAGNFSIIDHELWSSSPEGILISRHLSSQGMLEPIEARKINKASGLPNEFFTGKLMPVPMSDYAYVKLPWSFMRINRKDLYKPFVRHHYPLYINNITYSDSSITNDSTPLQLKKIVLPYNISSVDISFSALNFQPGNTVTYYCNYSSHGKLTKINLKDRKYYTLTNPPPGTYILAFYAIDQWGNRYNAPHHLTIIISAPFWMKGWFYILVLLVLAGIVFRVVKWRENKLVREKHILEEKVRMRTNEILQKNEELEEQKTEIETQNENIAELLHDIEDSIQTAKVIQESILPVTGDISRSFKNFFLYYSPKDIVSGDFYWYKETENSYYLGAFDCTGHGVAGAFMSLIGHNLLETTALQYPDAQPGKILNMLNEGVIETLKQDREGTGSRDGMDCTLLRISKTDGKCELAGAMNPLYLVRNNEIIQIKTDKFSIGIPVLGSIREFSTFDVETQPGDLLALASDGYIGQLGGPDGHEKIMPFRLRELLCKSAGLPGNEISSQLENFLTDWRKYVPQTDDVMVMGFKI